MYKTGAASWLSIRRHSCQACCPLLSEESASDLKLHSLLPSQGTHVLGHVLLQPRKLPCPAAPHRRPQGMQTSVRAARAQPPPSQC